MNSEFKKYVEEIVLKIGVSGSKKRKIEEDLYAALAEKQEATGESNPYILMGDPQEVAAEFSENMELENRKINFKLNGLNIEYKSKMQIFGMPLYHINAKPFGVAKGFFCLWHSGGWYI